jgi:hypothetical protein
MTSRENWRNKPAWIRGLILGIFLSLLFGVVLFAGILIGANNQSKKCVDEVPTQIWQPAGLLSKCENVSDLVSENFSSALDGYLFMCAVLIVLSIILEVIFIKLIHKTPSK